MPDPQRKQSCHCHICRGGMVDRSTVYRHRDRPRFGAITTHQHQPTFAEWQVSLGLVAASAAGRELDRNGNREDNSSEEDEGIRAEKRQRRSGSEMRDNDTIKDAGGNPVNEDYICNEFGNTPNDQDQGDIFDNHHPPGIEIENEEENDGPPDEQDEDDFEDEQDARVAALRAHADAMAAQLENEGTDDEAEPARDPASYSRIGSVKITEQFIADISQATLENGKLPEAIIERLRNPERHEVDISDPDTRLSLDLYMACTNSSEQTYKDARAGILRRYPECQILSYHSVEKLISDLTGVITINDDMCINSCHAFTGPFADRETCSVCSEPRYDPVQLQRSGKRVPRQQACTIPLGPQLQALRRSKDSAVAMKYRHHKTQEVLEAYNDDMITGDNVVYDDIFCGNDYLDLCERLELTEDDTTVSFSLDGAQLYQNKKSDTWIAIWIVNDYAPGTRYKKKHVLPALIVPGPNKPKNIDSYLFRSFHHLSALQRSNKDGVPMWDMHKGAQILSRIILLLVCADALGLIELDGRVGHHGAHGCRLGCAIKGRHKPSSGHYYTAHLRPNDSNSEDCNHPDFDFSTISRASIEVYETNLKLVTSSLDQNDYERNRKLTGISKPSIISGLKQKLILKPPFCFSVDLMHLLFINLGELLIPLWRGALKCEATDEKTTWDWATLVGRTWIDHGKLVAASKAYFPASFHRPPRNPAEKISSGYKATEYFLYIFGLGPAFFRQVLPKKYWKNFCKLVHGVRIIIQRQINGIQIREAQSYLIQFVEEYENLYYQRRTDRLHMCRPCLHTLLHTPSETLRVGPGAYASQFTMERAIGDLGKQIRQPSNPFGNLCQISLRRSQLNALMSMCPEIDKDSTHTLPRFSHNSEQGFVLMVPRDRYLHTLEGPERVSMQEHGVEMVQVRRWGRLQLPNGQVARSLFSESRNTSGNNRVTRNVKITIDDTVNFAEVQFFFLQEDEPDIFSPYALVSVYGPPDADMLEDSFHTLYACKYCGLQNLQVIPASSIISVISMQPLPPCPGDPNDLYFVVEKSGLDDTELTGYVDPI